MSVGEGGVRMRFGGDERKGNGVFMRMITWREELHIHQNDIINKSDLRWMLLMFFLSLAVGITIH